MNGKTLLRWTQAATYALLMAIYWLGQGKLPREINAWITLIFYTVCLLSLWLSTAYLGRLARVKRLVYLIIRIPVTIAVLILSGLSTAGLAVFAAILCLDVWDIVSASVFAVYALAVAIGILLFEWSWNVDALVFCFGAAVMIAWGYYGLSQWKSRRDEAELVDNACTAAARLAETNVRLQDYATQSQKLTIIQERNRFARDIHDSLGHILTSIIVTLEAVGRITRTEPEQAEVEIERIHEIAREGLAEVRRSVSALRAPVLEEMRGEGLWRTLVESFAETTGMDIKFHIDEDFNWVDDKINETVYRVVQESLTNAYRHGLAQIVDVAIWQRLGMMLIRVSDNGRGTAKINEGFGLNGIKERVGNLGGEVAWESEPGRGFNLGVQFPCQRGVVLGDN